MSAPISAPGGHPEARRDRIYMYLGALTPLEAPRGRIYTYFVGGRRAKHWPQWWLAHPEK